MKFLEAIKNQALVTFGLSEEDAENIPLAPVPSQMVGDWGFQVFKLSKIYRQSPDRLAGRIAKIISEMGDPRIRDVHVVKGFVNIELDEFEIAAPIIRAILDGRAISNASPPLNVGVEFSSPNTNKPQHLGHVRNNLLGDAVCKLLSIGHRVTRFNLVNDRGIHICKSMLAYQKFGNGETPESSGMKGDHFVGKYYVTFNTKLASEFAEWLDQNGRVDGDPNWFFNHGSELGREAKEMLRKWEDGDPEVLELWKTMNGWCKEGFQQTYDQLGIQFDHVDLESETYLLGQELVDEGLAKGLFFKTETGAVAFDLTKIGLPEGRKFVRRSDGTSMYITQDLGTAIQRFERFGLDRLIYVVADEQNNHFQTLFGILGLLRPELKGKLHHLSYGMVELPEGRMKSREGTVVDADDLVSNLTSMSAAACVQRGSDPEEDNRAEKIGLSALKFYVLNYNSKSKIKFDPNVALSLQGRTGPYVQYTYARICGLKRELGETLWLESGRNHLEHLRGDKVKDILLALDRQEQALERATDSLDPGKVCDWLYDVCSAFNSMYNDPEYRMKGKPEAELKSLILLCKTVQVSIRVGAHLLGLKLLEEM